MINILYSNRFSRWAVLFFAIILMVVSIIPKKSFADSPMESAIYSLIQDGEDVLIEIGIPDLMISKRHKVTWKSSTDSGIIVDDEVFQPGDSERVVEVCSEGFISRESCMEDPSVDCYSCGEDEDKVCIVPCNEYFMFLLTHECPKIEKVTYNIQYFDSYDSEGYEKWIMPDSDGSKDIVVEDVGQDCFGSDAGQDDGGGSEAEENHEYPEANEDNGSGGCGVVLF